MTEPDTISSSQIDRHLENVLSDTDGVGLPLIRETVNEPDDRWYGQLVVNSYVSLTDTPDLEIVLPVAAGAELLRGYVRLRSRLLATLADTHPHSLTLEPTPALLGGNYLYTAAFSSLHSAPETSSSDCFEILTTVLESITEAFARSYTSAGSADSDSTVFFDETAGSLGEAAAVLGATLAGVDESNRKHFERLGHGLSTVRQINWVLETDPSGALVIPPTLKESHLRTHAQQRQDDADHALDTLSATVDVTTLRAFVETGVSKQD
ncbi:polyprenyl synthetase [Halorubrum sp. AJ67]|uniref:polyprenyl synthetase n=1 Tax=Halorubrum sp. AJ67 TaxID=1173487 RepID=UPI00064E95C7|nr:polyprenyl synthetase [Halorubrum sp. AJ67]